MSLGTTFLEGVNTGRRLREAWDERGRRGSAEDAANIEAEIASFQPEQIMAQDGALPDGEGTPTGQYDNTAMRDLLKRHGEALAGLQDLDQVEKGRSRAAELVSERMNQHLQNGTALMGTDPQAALEQFNIARAYAPNDEVPEFSIAMNNGTPLLAVRGPEGNTEVLTTEMAQTFLTAASQGMPELIARGDQNELSRQKTLNTYLDRQATDLGYKKDAITKVGADASAAVDAQFDTVVQEVTQKFSTPSADGMGINETETKYKVPTGGLTPQARTFFGNQTATLLKSNLNQIDPQLQGREGAEYFSTVSPEIAADTVFKIALLGKSQEDLAKAGIGVAGVEGKPGWLRISNGVETFLMPTQSFKSTYLTGQSLMSERAAEEGGAADDKAALPAEEGAAGG